MKFLNNFFKKRYYRGRIKIAGMQIWDLEMSRQILEKALKEMKEEWGRKAGLIKLEKTKKGRIDMDQTQKAIAENVELEGDIKEGEKQLEMLKLELELKKKRKLLMEEILKEL